MFWTLADGTGRKAGSQPVRSDGRFPGAVPAFSLADGFFAIPAQTEMVPAGMEISVTIIGTRWRSQADP